MARGQSWSGDWTNFDSVWSPRPVRPASGQASGLSLSLLTRVFATSKMYLCIISNAKMLLSTTADKRHCHGFLDPGS